MKFRFILLKISDFGQIADQDKYKTFWTHSIKKRKDGSDTASMRVIIMK